MSTLTKTNPLAGSMPFDDFKPRVKIADAPILERVAQSDVQPDKAAVRQSALEHGFVIDNSASMVVRAKRQASGKVSVSRTLRLYVNDLNRFQSWCNDKGYSQAKGFEILIASLPGIA